MSMKQMKNSAFSLPHHLSYKPRYSFSALPLRISVVGGFRRRVLIPHFFATHPFFRAACSVFHSFPCARVFGVL
ncbi:hypothetical protein M405DRAFT_819075 [Rhizopogon salebrosus TDB-379]|nr:hypothetical protein M405DRAFT_819075 [Rhizopogon salebrosus TDB-379]